MAKPIIFESMIHQFSWAGSRRLKELKAVTPDIATELERFLRSLEFEKLAAKSAKVSWDYPKKGAYEFEFKAAKFYTRGDNKNFVEKQKEANMVFARDSIEERNKQFFDSLLKTVLKQAGVKLSRGEY